MSNVHLALVDRHKVIKPTKRGCHGTRRIVKKKERKKEEMTHKIGVNNLLLWFWPCVHLVDIRVDRKHNAGGDTLKKTSPRKSKCAN